jgi:type II secretion system protein J
MSRLQSRPWRGFGDPKSQRSLGGLEIPKHSRDHPGFTLIEVLFAVLIFSIVLVAIHTVFYSAVHLRNKAVQAFDQMLPLNQALAVIRQDLAGIVVPGGVLCGAFVTQGQSDTNLLSPGFYTTSGTLAEDQPWGEVQKVNYYLADSTNQVAGKDLFRSVSRNLLPVSEEAIENQRLMSGVDELVLWFYDGTQWREAWDSTVDDPPLPYAIKVQLFLTPGTNQPITAQQLPVELIVPLIETTGTNQSTQTASSTGGGA